MNGLIVTSHFIVLFLQFVNCDLSFLYIQCSCLSVSIIQIVVMPIAILVYQMMLLIVPTICSHYCVILWRDSLDHEQWMTLNQIEITMCVLFWIILLSQICCLCVYILDISFYVWNDYVMFNVFVNCTFRLVAAKPLYCSVLINHEW